MSRGIMQRSAQKERYRQSVAAVEAPGRFGAAKNGRRQRVASVVVGRGGCRVAGLVGPPGGWL